MNLQTLSSEAVSTNLSNHRNRGFFALFNNAFCAIARTLIVRNEIKVSVEKLRSGEQIWHVYDPLIGRTESFVSEEEALCWIEGNIQRSAKVEN
ncbi:MAG: hypothetical protein OHK0037_14230 [Elainellaceae cyanobacterium]